VTSSARSPFGSPRPHSYRLPIVTYPLAPLVSEILDLKVADKQTNRQTDRQNSTLSDYKGRLKLSAREPTVQTRKWTITSTVMHKVKTCSCCCYRTLRTQWVLQWHLPHRPQSAHETISSHLPVFLFSISSPRQKSQYLLVLTVLLDAAADDAADIERATAAARLLTAVIQKQYQKFIWHWTYFWTLHWQ